MFNIFVLKKRLSHNFGNDHIKDIEIQFDLSNETWLSNFQRTFLSYYTYQYVYTPPSAERDSTYDGYA
uniref:Uncharacterized protein n=1 Tax=Arion vulgaris TaxID=1028688 RepID=A0A0B6YYA3_9EUPU